MTWNSICRTVVAFGLNALYNRPKLASGAWGAWDPSNARDFIKYTVDQGIQVQAWQLGKPQRKLINLLERAYAGLFFSGYLSVRLGLIGHVTA